MDGTCNMDIQTVKGAKNIFFGGEGLFNTVVTGPGKVVVKRSLSISLRLSFTVICQNQAVTDNKLFKNTVEATIGRLHFLCEFFTHRQNKNSLNIVFKPLSFSYHYAFYNNCAYSRHNCREHKHVVPFSYC